MRTRSGDAEVPSYVTPNGIAGPPSLRKVTVTETLSYMLGFGDRLTTCPRKISHVSRCEEGEPKARYWAVSP